MRPVCWLGIDPSYSGYGVARLHADETSHTQKLNFSPGVTGKGSQRLDLIFRILQQSFETLALTFDVRAVALEGYAMNSKFGREMAGELGGLSRILIMRELHREPLIVPPSSLKKFVTGVGGATKDQMKAAVAEKWGEDFKSHDIADAYGLARIAKASQRGTDVDHEREVMAALKKHNTL